MKNWEKLIVKVLESIPIAIPSGLAAFGLVSSGLLLLDKLDSWLVLIFGVPAAIATSLIAYKLSSREQDIYKTNRVAANCIVLLLVILWIFANAHFTTQHLITNRDPGVYALTGVELITNDNLKIQSDKVPAGSARVSDYSPGFMPSLDNPKTLNAQGVHLLPLLLGLFGRILGTNAMFHMNILVGGVSLLAVYALARSLLRPQWAILAPFVLSLSLPVLYFSRDAYTEPLLMLFSMSSLALIVMATKKSSKSVWFLAGLLGGTGALTRIDFYIFALAVLASVFIYVMVTGLKGTKLKAIQEGAVFITGLSVGSILGWLDVAKLSQSYYASERDNIWPELVAVFLSLAIGLVLIGIVWVIPTIPKFYKRHKAKLSFLASWLWIIAAMLLISRPLWYRGFKLSDSGVVSRNFHEQTFNWIIWYLGPIIVLLGILGIALAIVKIIKKGDIMLLSPVLAVTSITLLYLIHPSISPDQVWASRRFLPISFPLITVFGLFAGQYIYDKTTKFKENEKLKQCLTILMTVAVVSPLFVSWQFFIVREYINSPLINQICLTIEPSQSVIWLGDARSHLVQPTDTICGDNSYGYGEVFAKQVPSKTELSKLAQNAAKAGQQIIIGTYGYDTSLLRDFGEMGLVAQASDMQIESTYNRPPMNTKTKTTEIYMALVLEDGSIKPLSTHQNKL